MIQEWNLDLRDDSVWDSCFLSDIICSSNFWVHFHISRKHATGVKCWTNSMSDGRLGARLWRSLWPQLVGPTNQLDQRQVLSQLFLVDNCCLLVTQPFLMWLLLLVASQALAGAPRTKVSNEFTFYIRLWPMQYSGPWPADLGSLPRRTGKVGGWPSWTSGVLPAQIWQFSCPFVL